MTAIASDRDLFVKKVCAKEIFGPNLRLGGKVVTVAEGDDQNRVEKSGQTAWAALRAALRMVDEKSKSLILVPRVGLEPTS